MTRHFVFLLVSIASASSIAFSASAETSSAAVDDGAFRAGDAVSDTGDSVGELPPPAKLDDTQTPPDDSAAGGERERDSLKDDAVADDAGGDNARAVDAGDASDARAKDARSKDPMANRDPHDVDDDVDDTQNPADAVHPLPDEKVDGESGDDVIVGAPANDGDRTALPTADEPLNSSLFDDEFRFTGASWGGVVSSCVVSAIGDGGGLALLGLGVFFVASGFAQAGCDGAVLALAGLALIALGVPVMGLTAFLIPLVAVIAGVVGAVMDDEAHLLAGFGGALGFIPAIAGVLFIGAAYAGVVVWSSTATEPIDELIVPLGTAATVVVVGLFAASAPVTIGGVVLFDQLFRPGSDDGDADSVPSSFDGE